ncbi:hypothetical protein FIU96_08700 [Marinobacter sp. THAF39]|nr:hypothetical protein FIV08_08770 [Marinobacter sp. THAF197a]QFT50706.1 hypothetical protein FIU96_08700 [Marinobacter sp. THAF39]
MILYKKFRSVITRALYRFLGLNIDYWCREVARLWSLPSEQLVLEREAVLAETGPLNASGQPVRTLAQLSSSSVLSKATLIDRFQKANAQKSPGMRYFSRHTSGTTGQPTEIILSRAELSRLLAVRDYCFRHHGISLGESEGRLWSEHKGIKSRVMNFLLNRRVVCPTGANAVTKVLELLRSNPTYLYGYSSLLLEAARLIDESGESFPPPKLVVCTAETILPAQKAFISKVFNAPVAEEYGSTEFDVIGFECSKGHRHLVNPWLVVEDGPERCLVSDVSRKSQSLVRYDLGDALELSTSQCGSLGSKQVIKNLQGRTINRFFYVSPDEKVHSSIFSRIIDEYSHQYNEMFSFLATQEHYGELALNIDAVRLTNADDLSEFVRIRFEEECGTTIRVTVNAGARQMQAGKRNYFIQKLTESI